MLAPRIPVLKDLEEGLQHFDLLCSMKNHPALFKQVFTPSSIYEISAHTFLDGLVVMYSAQQALKEKEEDIFKYFTDFILTLEHGGICLYLLYNIIVINCELQDGKCLCKLIQMLFWPLCT